MLPVLCFSNTIRIISLGIRLVSVYNSVLEGKRSRERAMDEGGSDTARKRRLGSGVF